MSLRPKAEPRIIKTSCFDEAPADARFAVVLTSHSFSGAEQGVIMPEEDLAAAELVRDAYVAHGIIGKSSEELRELQDPAGSCGRYAVLERVAQQEGEGEDGQMDTKRARVFATCKLVHRESAYDPRLPVEKIFPYLFMSEDTVGCLEISRVVSQHPDDEVQRLGFFALLRAAYGYSLEGNTMAGSMIDPNPEIQELIEQLGSRQNTKVKSQEELEQQNRIKKILCLTEGPILDYATDRVNGPGLNPIWLNNRLEPAFVQEARRGLTELHAASFDVQEIRRIHESGQNPLLELFLEKIRYHSGLGLFDYTMANYVGETPEVFFR